MNEENEQVTETAPESEPTSETLEDILPEFTVESQSTTEQTQTAPVQEPAPAAIQSAPDPVTDPDAFKQWQTSQQSEMAALKQDLRTTVESLKSQASKAQERAEEKEIQGLSQDIATKIGEGTDPEMVEVALGLKYRKSDTFKKIWDNRHANETAFKKAMSVVTNEMKGKFKSVTDPQVAENVRAMDQSLNKLSGKTQPTSTVEQKAAEMKGSDFDSFYQQIMNGAYD